MKFSVWASTKALGLDASTRLTEEEEEQEQRSLSQEEEEKEQERRSLSQEQRQRRPRLFPRSSEMSSAPALSRVRGGRKRGIGMQFRRSQTKS